MRRAVRAMLAGVLVLTLGGYAGPAPTRWEHLDGARIGLAAGDGTTLTTGALRATAGPGGVTLRLPMRPGERFFGLGARYGAFDLRGQVLRNRTADGMGHPTADGTYSPMPFLLSSRGYGLHLDTLADATFDLTGPEITIRVAASDVTVHLLTGPDPASVLTAHAALVGRPPLPPAWGLGVWKTLVGGPERVRADTDALLAAGVPIDAVWVYDVMDPPSGFGWPWPIYGRVPTGHYPDPAALVADLHSRGLKVLGYVHPFLVPGHADHAEAAGRGFLVRAPDGTVFTEPWMGTDRRAYVDFTNPDATAWWQARLRHAVAVTGFDGAMQDYGEDAPVHGVYADGRPGALVRNDYPVLYARAARAAAQAARPDGTVLFARAGYTGGQSVVTGRFTGDQARNWSARNGLASVLPGMLNGSVSGWPYWGPDVGGFFDGDGARDRELWSRWVQLGALSPLMRDHLGAQADPVDAHTDAVTLATFRGYARLHRALVPYLHGLAREAHETGMPLMRPVWLAAPDDPLAWAATDQYLLGPDLLVAPVLTPGTTERAVYLPPGTWRDYWTGATTTGPGRVVVDAPAQHIPLLVRTGSPLTAALPPPTALALPPTP
ncbi:MAG: TIM-barrel domain-containing protein [Pseudonocardia sp.]